MDETSVSLSDAGILAGTPVSLPHGEVIEGTLPRGITVQIISAPSVIQTSQITSQQTVTTLDKGEPGIAQTLLNIAQPEGYVTEDGVNIPYLCFVLQSQRWSRATECRCRKLGKC